VAINPTATRNEDGSWAFTWSAGTAPYSIWLDGRQLESSLATEAYTYDGGEYDETAPPIEILNDGETAENYTYPPRVRVQWRGLLGATTYIVQANEGGWVDLDEFTEDGSGYYQWESEALADATTHQHRVLALGEGGAEGTPIAFSVDLVRNPAPPSVVLDIVAGDVQVASG
jgi:hypothetical protein